jgi:hypothetical protein
MRFDIMPERPCVPVGQVTSLPVLIRLRAAACCQPQAARGLYRDRVLLLTDGQANHGVVDPMILIRHAADLTEDGIGTTTLGYGDDFNEDFLTVLTGSRLSVCIFPLQMPPASCRLPTVSHSRLADGGDVTGAIQRLTDVLAVPEVTASSDAEVHAARRRIKDLLHELQERGFDRISRKHMVYSSRAWAQGRSKAGAD